MLEVLVEVDGRPLSRWACDGMLVATPTGSTAYAFSAGGPVIWPGVDALLVVPLSAHALFARPLVLGPTSTVVVEVIDGSQTHGVVWCDGRRSIELRTGMEIEVTRGHHRLRLARLSEAPFTDRLVNKFGLRVEGWRGAADRRGTGSTVIDELRITDLGVISEATIEPAPRPHRRDRRDRRRQDHDRHRTRPAAGRAGPTPGPYAAARTGPGCRDVFRVAEPAILQRRARAGGELEDDELIVARHLTVGRPLPGLRRGCAGAGAGLRRDHRAADRHPRAVRAAPAGRADRPRAAPGPLRR